MKTCFFLDALRLLDQLLSIVSQPGAADHPAFISVSLTELRQPNLGSLSKAGGAWRVQVKFPEF